MLSRYVELSDIVNQVCSYAAIVDCQIHAATPRREVYRFGFANNRAGGRQGVWELTGAPGVQYVNGSPVPVRHSDTKARTQQGSVAGVFNRDSKPARSTYPGLCVSMRENYAAFISTI